jgi:hypothetical protein
MVYKNLQKIFFFALWRKVITTKPQSQTKPVSIKIRPVQSGRFYASVTRTENQPTICQNNQATQKQTVLPSTGRFMVMQALCSN